MKEYLYGVYLGNTYGQLDSRSQITSRAVGNGVPGMHYYILFISARICGGDTELAHDGGQLR